MAARTRRSPRVSDQAANRDRDSGPGHCCDSRWLGARNWRRSHCRARCRRAGRNCPDPVCRFGNRICHRPCSGGGGGGHPRTLFQRTKAAESTVRSLCRGRGCLRGAGDYRAGPRARSRGRRRTRARAGDRLDAFRTTPSRRLRCRSRCCARVLPCCSRARANNSEPVGSRPPRRAFACAASCTVDRGFNLPARERRSGRVLARVPIDTRSGPGRPRQIRESDRSDCPEPATSPCSPPRRPVTAGRSLALAKGSSTSTAPGWSGGAAFALCRSCRDFCLDPSTPSLLA